MSPIECFWSSDLIAPIFLKDFVNGFSNRTPISVIVEIKSTKTDMHGTDAAQNRYQSLKVELMERLVKRYPVMTY